MKAKIVEVKEQSLKLGANLLITCLNPLGDKQCIAEEGGL